MNYLLNIINYILIFIFLILTFKPKRTLKCIIYAISVFLFLILTSMLLLNIPLFIGDYNILPIILQLVLITIFIPLTKDKKYLYIYIGLLIPIVK